MKKEEVAEVKEGGIGTILQQQLGAVNQEHAARRAKRLGSLCERRGEENQNQI